MQCATKAWTRLENVVCVCINGKGAAVVREINKKWPLWSCDCAADLIKKMPAAAAKACVPVFPGHLSKLLVWITATSAAAKRESGTDFFLYVCVQMRPSCSRNLLYWPLQTCCARHILTYFLSLGCLGTAIICDTVFASVFLTCLLTINESFKMVPN
jgi:hypothetical protein